MKNVVKGNQLRLVVASLALAMLVGVGFYFFPMISDDLHFQIPFRGYIEGEEEFDWNKVWDYIEYVYYTNNIRIPNVITPFIVCSNIIVPTLFSIIALWYTLYCGLLIAGVDRVDNWKMWLYVLIYFTSILLFFPWLDQMYLRTFQMNYLWPTSISLYIIYSLLEKRHGVVVMFALGLILGFWHEAFAGPLCVSLIVMAILFRDFRRWDVRVAVLGLIAGLIWFILAPCMGGGSWSYFEGRLYVVLPYLLPSLVYLVLNIVLFFRRRDVVTTRTNVVLLMVSVASTGVLAVYSTVGARIGALGIVCSIIGIIYSCVSTVRFTNIYYSKIFVVLMSVMSLAHVIAVDVMCWRLGNQTQAVLRKYRLNPDAVVFAEMDLREDAPLICLQKPYYDWFAHRSTSRSFERMYGIGDYPIMVVPEALRTYSAECSDSIGGTANMTYYKGYTVGRSLSDDFANVDLSADYGMGERVRRFYVVSFRSDTDGRVYGWYHPENSWMDHVLFPRPVKIDVLN